MISKNVSSEFEHEVIDLIDMKELEKRRVELEGRENQREKIDLKKRLILNKSNKSV